MNWSIEQNYILLQFVCCYGENEWFKHVSELRDLFSIYLTAVLDVDINNFTEEDFRRQYNYILATTRQECQKQGLKIVKSNELTEIALKNFYNYLEQQQPNRDDYAQLQMDIKLLEDGRISQIDKERLREMREKVYCVVGEDLIGIAFGLGRMENKVSREKREKCIKEISESWLRRLNDGRICTAGDIEIFPEEVLSQCYEVSNLSLAGANTDTDSDATETLEEYECDDGIRVISFEAAKEQHGLGHYKNLTTEDSKFVKKFSNQKFIPGWQLIEGNDRPDLDERFGAFTEDLSKSVPTLSEFINSKISPQIIQMIAENQNRNPIQSHYSPHSSASTQEALTTRLTVSVATESCEMTPGSQSVDTAISHATFDDLDDVPKATVKEIFHGRRKKRARQVGTSVRKLHTKGGYGNNRDSESQKKIMRNITKMVLDHPYSSILTKPIRSHSGLFKQPILNITEISHDVTSGNFVYYEQFIETIILFFLQMKVYYLNDRQTVKKIDSVYADISNQLSIIYPGLNDTAPLSDLIQRRQSRFQGHYV